MNNQKKKRMTTFSSFLIILTTKLSNRVFKKIWIQFDYFSEAMLLSNDAILFNLI